MKNITVSLDDESYRQARIKAAAADTSVSALVRDFLTRFAGEESEFEKLQRQEEELRRSVTAFRASDRLSREEAHDRHAVH